MTVNYILSLFRKIGYDSTFWYREIIQNLLCLCKKKTQVVFSFFISSYFEFSPYECPEGLKWKMKKTTWVFFLHKNSKFWSISIGQKVERKPLFSEECMDSNFFLSISSLTPMNSKRMDAHHLKIYTCKFLG